MVLNRRSKRNFITNKYSYIGMIILVIIACGFFLGINTATVSIKEEVDNNREQSIVEDANFNLYSELTQEEISYFQDKYDLMINKNPYQEIVKGYNNSDIKFITESKINAISILDGKKISKSNEILVDRYFLKANKLSINDKISINNDTFKITGTFTTPNVLTLTKLDTDLVADGSKYGLIIVDKKVIEDTNTFYYTIKYNKDNESEFRVELNEKESIINYTSYESNKRINQFDGEIYSFIVLSYIAPLFLLIMSILVLGIVQSIMLKREYKYIGTLEALGFSHKQIFRHYLRIPGFIGIVGSIGGILLGILLIEPIGQIISIEYNVPNINYHIDYINILIIIVIPLVFFLLASYISIKRALKLTIVAELKSEKNNKSKSFIRFIPLKLSFKVRFKLKELLSNISRCIIMIVGIMASSIFIMTGFILNESIDILIESNLQEKYNYNYQYVYNSYSNESYGEDYMIGSFYFKNDEEKLNVTLHGYTNDSKYFRFIDKDGNKIPSNLVVASSSVAKRLDIKAGDTISLVNNSSLNICKIKIDDISDLNYGDFIYLPNDTLNQMLGLPINTYIGTYSDREIDNIKNVKTIIANEDAVAGLETSMETFKLMIIVLGLVSVAIGIIVIYIVTVLLIEDNTTNISTLKVLGYNKKSIKNLITKSSYYLLIIGFILSLPLSKLALTSLLDEMTTNMYINFVVDIKISYVILAFIFINIVYFITLKMFNKKLDEISMVECLKNKE